MTQRTRHAVLKIHGQGRSYVAVVGVTVGMLVAGLAVPLAFGRLPSSGLDRSSVQLDESLNSGPSTPASGAPGSVVGPASAAPQQGGTAAGASSGAGLPGATSVGAAGSSGTSGPGGAMAALKATDQGVTATTVKLGIVLLDIQKLEPLGFAQPHFTPNEQRDRFQFFIDEVNKKGGLSGRKITP